MNLEQHKQREDMKVWLSREELAALEDAAADISSEHRIAISLGGRCGLRSHEILDVAPKDVADTDAGTMLRVWHGKGDKYRETPIPTELATTIRTVGEMRDAGADTSILSPTTTRTLQRWVSAAAGAVDDDDEGWEHLTPHDLRRTWATQLRGADVDAMVVCDWGGWNDLETFLDHYRGTSTPEAQRRERDKVDWL